MFCSKCGQSLPDNAAFCDSCGANLKADFSDNKTAQQEPQPVIVNEEPKQQPLDTIKNAGAELGSKLTKVRKKLPKKFLIIPVAVVALVAIVVSFATIPALRRFWEDNIARPISGTVVKTVGSDEDYLKFVEKEAFNGYGGYISTATNVYGTLLDTTKDDTYVEASLSLNASEDALEIIEENFVNCDLSFINETVLKINAGQNGQLYQVGGELEVNGKSILDPSILLNMDKEEAFISLLALNSKYIRYELDGIDEEAALEVQNFIQSEALRKAIPSEDELNDLLSKYIKIALDELDGVTLGEDQLEIGDIEETLTTVELEFTEETAMNMVRAILEEAKKDKKLKSYILDIATVLSEDEDIIDDPDEIYEVFFLEGIDEALDEIDDYDPSDEVIFILIDYVDSSHKVVGRELYMGDDTDAEPVIFYGTAHDGKNYAFELSVPSANIYVSGEGTDKGGVLTGDYIVSVEGQDMLKLSLEKFDTNAITDGKIKGKVTIAPSKELLDAYGADGIEYYGVSIADLALQLDLDIEEKKADIAVNVLVDEEIFAGVTVAYKISGAPNLKVPASKNVIDIDDSDEWFEEIDLDKFIKNLEKAKLPEEIIEFVEDMVDELDSVGGLLGGVSVPSIPEYEGDYEVYETMPSEDYYEDDYYYYYD